MYKSNSKDFWRTSYLLDDMKQLKESNGYIVDLVLYIRDIDFIMNTEGSMRSDFYFDDVQPQGLREIVGTNGFWQISYQDDYRMITETFDAILFGSSLPMNSEEANIYMAAVIDKSHMLEDVMEFQLMQEGQTFILDPQSGIIASTSGESSYEAQTLWDCAEKAKKNGLVFLGGEEWLAVPLTSEITDWTYLTLVPYRMITDKTFMMALVTFGCGVVIVLLSAVMSLLSTKRLYQPIQNLMQKVSGEEKKELPDGMDEFSFIGTNMDQMLLENQDLQMKLLKNVPMLQQSFLRNLLHGQVLPEEIGRKLEDYQIMMPNRYYCVLLFLERSGENQSERIQQVFRDNFINFYVINERTFTTVVINFNECDVKQVIRQFQPHPFVIAQGAVYESVLEIEKSYNQAKYAFQYRSEAVRFEYLSIAELIETDFSRHRLPVHFEEQYRNCVESDELTPGLTFWNCTGRCMNIRKVPMCRRIRRLFPGFWKKSMLISARTFLSTASPIPFRFPTAICQRRLSGRWATVLWNI